MVFIVVPGAAKGVALFQPVRAGAVVFKRCVALGKYGQFLVHVVWMTGFCPLYYQPRQAHKQTRFFHPV